MEVYLHSFLTSATNGTPRKGGCVGPGAGVGGLENSNIKQSRVQLSSTAWRNYLGKHIAEVTASDTGYYAGLF